MRLKDPALAGFKPGLIPGLKQHLPVKLSHVTGSKPIRISKLSGAFMNDLFIKTNLFQWKSFMMSVPLTRSQTWESQAPLECQTRFLTSPSLPAHHEGLRRTTSTASFAQTWVIQMTVPWISHHFIWRLTQPTTRETTFRGEPLDPWGQGLLETSNMLYRNFF